MQVKQKHLQFTCVLSVFDRRDLFLNYERVIHSIFKNTILPNFFYLIVDGPISYNFRKKINLSKKKFKIKVFWLKNNIGEAKAYNKIIKKVKTPWVFKCDGDDFCLPNRFQQQIKFMKKNYDLIGSHIKEINQRKDIISIKRVPLNETDIRKYAKYRNPFNHMTVAYKTKAFLAVGGYPNVYLKEDYCLWVKFIYYRYKCININKFLVHATVNEDFFKRRSGLKYIISEFYLYKFLKKFKINYFLEGIMIFLLRVLLISTNSYFKKIFYKIFLRRS
jgi:hypothetical protein